MGAMKQLLMDHEDQLDSAREVAFNMGALNKCKIHEEYTNPNWENNDFFEEVLHLWHEKNLEIVNMHIESREVLMKVFEEAIYQPACCPSCEKNASEEPEKKCKRLDNLQYVMPGWACCKCRTYNDYSRPVCKSCGHKPCYPPAEGIA